MQERIQFDANDATAEDVCRWLQIGLDAYFKEDIGRWAFRPFEQQIGIRDDLADDIRAIYDGLVPAAQGRWRLAIRDLLAMHGREVPGKDTRVLVDLAALIRAHEVLEVLPALVARDKAPLFYQVLRTATELASQTNAARSCLERIRTSPSFSPEYAGHVLVALCRADPDGWIRHVENLSQAMDILADRLTTGSTALRHYASAILDNLSLERVGVGLREIEGRSTCKWLWNEWLTGPNSLLYYEPHAELGHRLLLRDQRTVAVTLDEPLRTSPLFTAVLVRIQPDETAQESKTWVAAYRNEKLTDLESMDYGASIEWLADQLNVFSRDALAVRTLLSTHKQPPPRAVVLSPNQGVLPLAAIDSDKFVDSSSLHTMTDRIRYIRPFRKKIDATRGRVAIGNPAATKAVACAIGLAAQSSLHLAATSP